MGPCVVLLLNLSGCIEVYVQYYKQYYLLSIELRWCLHKMTVQRLNKNSRLAYTCEAKLENMGPCGLLLHFDVCSCTEVEVQFCIAYTCGILIEDSVGKT